MDGPYNSLKECPGQHKVLVRRKPRWQSGDVRNIDDCSENGINETFESNETYKPAGVDHHVSAIKLWEASLPGVKLHGFVADLWKHFRQIGIGLNLVMVFWCHYSGTRRFGRLRGCPFGAAACVQGCARLPMAICAILQHHLLVPVQHYQDDHHCVELPLPTVLRKLGRLSSAFMVSLVQSWPLLVAISIRYPVKFTACLAPRLTSLRHRVKYKSFPRESIPSVASSTRSFRPRNWAKVTLLRSLVNSVSQQDNCLVDLGACIWHLSSCVSTGKMVVPTSQLKFAFWLYVLPRGPFRAVLPHSGTPFVITMSDVEGTGSVAAAIWSP